MSDEHTGPGREDDRPQTDEDRARLFHEQVKRLHALDLVRAMLADVVTLAYQKLGLTAETADLRDLDDVRVAIETVRRLVEVLESEGAGDEARTFRATLAALQLQFAAAASAAPSPAAASAAESVAPGTGEDAKSADTDSHPQREPESPGAESKVASAKPKPASAKPASGRAKSKPASAKPKPASAKPKPASAGKAGTSRPAGKPASDA